MTSNIDTEAPENSIFDVYLGSVLLYLHYLPEF
jgi:hypothetical protein